MTPAEAAYWERVNRRIGSLTPDVARSLLKAFQAIRDSLSESELVRMVSTGQIDRLFDSQLSKARLDAAFQPVRDRMRQGIVSGVKYFARDLPKTNITFAFDVLDPRVITAVRQLETSVISGLADDVREVVRAFVENGLRDGAGAKDIAREIRNLVGISPSQEETVRGYRSMLESGDRTALSRGLRDRRYDSLLDRLLGKDGQGLSAEQVDRMTLAYRRKMIARNADTIARTAASDSLKLAQRLAIDDAVKLGIYDRSKLEKTWLGVMDDRERPEHVAMEGETVPYDAPFSNGQMIPGDTDWNCRCVPRYAEASQ